MRKLLFVPAMALLAWGCSDSTEPSVATTVAIAPGSLTLDAVGARQVVHASVANQRGKAMTGALLTWSSSSPAVTVAGAGGDSAFVTSASNGTATVTATSGSASGGLQVQVAQVAAAVAREAGDGQNGVASAQLANPVRVRVRDRLDAPVAGQTVTFAVQSGGGSVSATTVVTGADGTAGVNWTLGPVNGPNTVTASFPGSSLAPLVFSAIAGTPARPPALSIRSGGYQAAMAGTVLPPATVVLVDGTGAALRGVTVNFSITGGGGTIANANVATDSAGEATLNGWRIGTSGNINTVTVTAVGINVTPVVLRAVECNGGGGAGYAITLCLTTPMNTAQRAAFQNAAARWATIIKGDLQDVVGTIPEGSCGAWPSANFQYDDLLIFAAADPIDGPGQILGQAGPCFVRSGNRGLPVTGIMQFDVADLATLESNGQLSSVILHEMGHVLGIGSMWSSFGLLQSPSTDTNTLDTYYSGVNGIAGFDAIGGTTYTGGQKVPVENLYGQGTRNSHWREAVLRNELMTGFIGAGSNPLSVLTVRSLTDMGYVVDPASGDPFSLTLTVRAPATEEKSVKMENDVFTGARYTISSRGEIARIR